MSTAAVDSEHRPVTGRDADYLPPMGKEWLLPLYDPLTRLVGVGRVHRRLVAAAGVRPGHRVLEIGCGTGNLALTAKAAQPEALVVGLDPDFAALARARRKAHRRGLDVQWDVGSAADLPYPDGSVDRVLSSLMLHHLPAGQKERALAEVRRVLTPDGELHLVDIGGPHGGHGPLHRRAQADPRLQDQAGEGLADLLRGAGFGQVTETGQHLRFLGPLTAYRATR
jgi:ubiquinone/menaquinone biosynthesis C-methylase UbiE